MLEPIVGLFTFRAEGNDIPGSPFFSRKIHWPGNKKNCEGKDSLSGVTIGRGYDMKLRNKDIAFNDLVRAGVPKITAEKIAEGAALLHCQASEFVDKNKDKIGEISHDAQLSLFNMIYPGYVSKAQAFYNKWVVNNKKIKQKKKWEDLSDAVKDIFVDVHYQGGMSLSFAIACATNDVDYIIENIKSSRLFSYEPGRHRISFLENSKLKK